VSPCVTMIKSTRGVGVVMVLSQVSQVSRESKQTWRRRLQDRRRVNTTDLIGGSIADDSVKDDNGGSCRAHAGNYALGEWPARQYPKRTHGQAAQRGQQENERCPSAEEGATTSERPRRASLRTLRHVADRTWRLRPLACLSDLG
jgi:hypothetical protein